MAKIGVQLWVVKEMLKQDPEATMKMVANFGYEGVEYSGMTDTPALTFRLLQNKYNLVCCGIHYGLTEWKKGIGPLMEYNYILGNSDLACHWIDAPDRGDKDKYLSYAALFNKNAPLLKANGFSFYYHNHDYEFKEVFDGQRAMDILLNNTDRAFMGMELHISALPPFGIDVVEYIKKLGGRLTKLHIPVLDKEGNIILEQAVIDAAKATGCLWYIVEQAVSDAPGCASLGRSVGILRDMLNT